MSPEVKSFNDLAFLCTASDIKTSQFLHTMFGVIDDEEDIAYFGQLNVVSQEFTRAQFTVALKPILCKHIFPLLPLGNNLTIYNSALPDSNFYIKRPTLTHYEEYKDNGLTHIMTGTLLEEAIAYEAISQRPHPGIIKYHCCWVRDGRITGLVLDKYEENLNDYCSGHRDQDQTLTAGDIDKERFLAALEEAVRHLHSSDMRTTISIREMSW